MLRIAHRGHSANAPENTLAAFRQAMAQGVEGIEFDVRLSADGVPVVIHDEVVDRTTNGSGVVREMTVAELKALDAGSRTSPRYAGERIPTLVEALSSLRGTLALCIELKAPGTALPTVALLREMEMENQAIIFSFNADWLREVAHLAPSMRRLLLGNWTPLDDAAAFADWMGLAREVSAGALGIPERVLHTAHVEAIHRARIGVIAWTVNDAERMRTLAAMGVDGIIADDAGLLVRTVKA